MERKRMIFTIIVLSVFLSGQLTAEEIVGRSIFPNIETPHPYPGAVKGNTLVWSTNIHEPGAAWIKIHFANFRLNSTDYVDLIDMDGRVMERINGRDVAGKGRSKFNVTYNDNKTVNFWGPAIDGDTVVVKLNRKSNKKNGLGFTIDEIGVGNKPIVDKRLETINDKEEKVDIPGAPLWHGNMKLISIRYMGNTVDISDSFSGRMLYRKINTWYTCNGTMNAGTGNHFFPSEAIIASPDSLNTVEVRLYVEITEKQDVKTFPGYYTYYNESVVKNASSAFINDLRLRIDNERTSIDHDNEFLINGRYVNLSETCQPASDYPGGYDEETWADWEEDEFEPSLNRNEYLADPVVIFDIIAEDENTNCYAMQVGLNEGGEVEVLSMEQISGSSGIQVASDSGISLTKVGPWWPICCYVQKAICDCFQRFFRWLNLNCTGCFNSCINKSVDNPCHSCGKWGLSWLLCIWFGNC